MDTNFYYITDIIGHEIMQYLDHESMYSIKCVPYLSNILDKVVVNNSPLKYIWRDQIEVEQYEKENMEYIQDAFERYYSNL